MSETCCRTCGRPVSSPHRVYNTYGKVVEGCVDSDHTGHLVSPSESSSWHNRKAAKEIRKRLDAYRK